LRFSIPDQYRGIACTLLAGFLFVAQDAVIKWMTGAYPTGEIMTIRGIIALLFTGVLIWRQGGIGVLRVTNGRLQLLRALTVVCTTVAFISALKYLPLATAMSVSFAGPLIVTAMAPRFLGEHVGWRRWSAVTVGFIGVIVIFRPGFGAMQWVLLLPLGSALLSAVRDITTRTLAGQDHPTGILFYALVAVTISGTATIPFGWVMPDLGDWYLFAITGVMVSLAQLFTIIAYRHAQVTTLAPFKYFSLIWGIGIGFAVWGDIPDSWTLAGSSLIIGSGLYILHRERGRPSA
jgi:drug/metabolite transporter (DMT)-like permease